MRWSESELCQRRERSYSSPPLTHDTMAPLHPSLKLLMLIYPTISLIKTLHFSTLFMVYRQFVCFFVCFFTKGSFCIGTVQKVLRLRGGLNIIYWKSKTILCATYIGNKLQFPPSNISRQEIYGKHNKIVSEKTTAVCYFWEKYYEIKFNSSPNEWK